MQRLARCSLLLAVVMAAACDDGDVTEMDTSPGDTAMADATETDSIAPDAVAEITDPDASDTSAPDDSSGSDAASDPDQLAPSDVPSDAPSDATEVFATFADVLPILEDKCAECHSATGATPLLEYHFVNTYAEMLVPSTLCPGENVGVCIGLAVENQEMEGARCRTYVVTPFHREGWTCLTEDERATIASWVSGGFIE